MSLSQKRHGRKTLSLSLSVLTEIQRHTYRGKDIYTETNLYDTKAVHRDLKECKQSIYTDMHTWKEISTQKHNICDVSLYRSLFIQRDITNEISTQKHNMYGKRPIQRNFNE